MRRRGSRGQRGLRFKGRTLFFTPHYQYLADIVSFRSPDAAKQAGRELQKQFGHASTREKKRRVKQATVSAANRCLAAAKSPNLSDMRKRDLREIAQIYRSTYTKMMLPHKP